MTAKAYKLAGSAWQRPSFIYPSASPNNDTRLIVEVGPGRGDFLFHLAKANPDAAVVGIEIKEQRSDKIVKRIEKRGLKNVWIVNDDARFALPALFSEKSVDELHILFPDPWPKRRHGKNRTLSKKFLADCAKFLKNSGTISIATDDEAYANEIAKNAKGVPELASVYPDIILTEKSEVFPTFFALKWQAEGRKTYYQKYFKT